VEIVKAYQKKDRRIGFARNASFVNAIDNHNIAFSHISTASIYCKVVSADDWLYSDCITRLVHLAEANPSVSVVLSYALNANGVRWIGLPAHQEIFSGSDIGRRFLLDTMALGAPSSHLYRSSFVRAEEHFFPGCRPSADAAACLNCLRHSDLGVVHRILSFERLHDRSVTAGVRQLDAYLLDRLELLLEYGSVFLTGEEMERRLHETLRYYYRVLATTLINRRGGSKYWSHHKARLAELGFRLSGARFGYAILAKLADLILNPKDTIEKGLMRAHDRRDAQK
jgi:hypothetical protein